MVSKQRGKETAQALEETCPLQPAVQLCPDPGPSFLQAHSVPVFLFICFACPFNYNRAGVGASSTGMSGGQRHPAEPVLSFHLYKGIKFKSPGLHSKCHALLNNLNGTCFVFF